MSGSSSAYLLDLAAVNFGWNVKGLSRRIYERDNITIEVYFTASGGVRSAYFTVGSSRSSTDVLRGGVPAITAELKRFGG